MQKPNVSLKFAAAAISASRKARRASTKTVRAYFQKKAQQYLAKAALAKDAGHALRIIAASNKAAVEASAKARSLKADFDDDMIVDDDIDMIDDAIDMDDDIVIAEAEDDEDEESKEEVDAEDEDEDEDEAEDDEVDARLASILARTRARRRALARLQAKRQNRR